MSGSSHPSILGRQDFSADAPTLVRKRGAQPGNLNALKHGLYVHRDTPLIPNAEQRAQLSDMREYIVQLKSFMRHLYATGMQSTDPAEITRILRSLSLASIAITRLIHTQGWNVSSHQRDQLLAAIDSLDALEHSLAVSAQPASTPPQ